MTLAFSAPYKCSYLLTYVLTYIRVCVLLKVMSSELEKIMQEQVRQDDTWLQQYLSELL